MLIVADLYSRGQVSLNAIACILGDGGGCCRMLIRELTELEYVNLDVDVAV